MNKNQVMFFCSLVGLTASSIWLGSIMGNNRMVKRVHVLLSEQQGISIKEVKERLKKYNAGETTFSEMFPVSHTTITRVRFEKA